MSKSSRRQIITAVCYDKRGRILSIGRNSYVKTHPMQAKLAKECGKPGNIYLHAEIHAILQIKDWSKIEKMTVVRLNNEGKGMNAAPCPICRKMIELAGIKHVEHT